MWSGFAVLFVALAGPVAEVAGSAATVAATQTAQANHAHSQELLIVDGFKRAQDGAADRTASAADEAGK